MGDHQPYTVKISPPGNFLTQVEKIFEGLAENCRAFGVSNVIGQRPRLHVAGEAKVEKFLLLEIELNNKLSLSIEK